METRTPVMHATDEELLSQFRDSTSRRGAFDKIVRKYQEKLYYHVRRMVLDHDDANDLVQNTFIKAWHGLDNYRGDARLYTWLYRIATNETLTFLKKKKTAMHVPIDETASTMADGLQEDVLFTGSEIQRRLQQAIATLPDKQRLVFNMRYFDGIKYEQMSQILDTSVGALKASYHHAVKKIENYFEER